MPKGVYPRKPKKSSLSVEWQQREDFKPFGDRLGFLSPEQQHITTGRLRIMPPKEDRRVK